MRGDGLGRWMRCGPGVSRGGRPTFLRRNQRKVGKVRAAGFAHFAQRSYANTKGGPTGRVPSLRCGQPAMLGHGAALRNSLCACGAPLRQPQRVRARGACFAAPAPRPALLGTARGEGNAAWAIAALGLGIYSLSLWERVGVRASHSKRTAAYALSSTGSNAFTPQRKPIKRNPLSKKTRPFFPVRAGWAGRAFDRLAARPLLSDASWSVLQLRPAPDRAFTSAAPT